jgi:glutathione S-transferase
MLTLIHAPRSRSSRILWLLEELGADYEVQYVDIRRADGSGERDPANPHPAGQVPALIHDGAVISESAAVVLYLTDLFPQSALGRPIGHPERGAYLTWLAYYAGVVEPAVTARYAKLGEPGTPFAKLFDELGHRLEAQLSQHAYLLGDTPSGADILFASIMQWAASLMPDLDVLRAHAARMATRPALARAMAKDAA